MGPLPITFSHKEKTVIEEAIVGLLRSRNPYLFPLDESKGLAKETREKLLSSPLPIVLKTTDNVYLKDEIEHRINEDSKTTKVEIVTGVLHAILAGNFQKFEGMLEALQSICQREDISPINISVRDAITLITTFYIKKTK